MVKHENVSHKKLIPDVLDCITQKFTTTSSIQKSIEHLGPVKRSIESDDALYTTKKSEVLNAIRDYLNIKHIFKATKILYEGKSWCNGKFYLSEKLNPWLPPTPIKHFNKPENKIAIVYTIWYEKRFISYLKYSLLSLIVSTDVSEIGDIVIFVTDEIYETSINCLENLVDKKCFVKIEDFNPFKYGVITHPILEKYDQIVLLDADAFIIGRRNLLTNIKEHFERDDSKIFMMPCTLDANYLFWDRKQYLCKGIENENYLDFFYKYADREKINSYLENEKWWLSPIVIYNNRKHFKEPGFEKYALQNIWHRQMCDETVFIMWALEHDYDILPVDFFFPVSDRYKKEPHISLRGYHPIVGTNTTNYSNEEMIMEIEMNYENFLREKH
jgi:hypothetical protein